MNPLGSLYNQCLRFFRASLRLFKKVYSAPFLISSYQKVAKSEARQRALFDTKARRFQDRYLRARQHVPTPLLVPMWRDYIGQLENAFLPAPPFHFLKHPLIESTMSAHSLDSWIAIERSYLEKRFTQAQLTRLLLEDPVGSPRLTRSPYATSGSSIHNLYGLAQFLETTGADMNSFYTVIEWGGGYGCLAKIFHRLAQHQHTYIIIDTPLFSCLQWLYLSVTLGADKVHLITSGEDAPRNSKINLVPLSHLRVVPPICDVFISTWALSESAPAAQELVLRSNWFGAQHLLLAYAKNDTGFPTSETVGLRALRDGAIIAPIDFLPGSFYAFK